MNIPDKFKDHILDSMAEGVFAVDKNFRINFFNKAAERITGHKKEDVIGKFCKHIFRSDFCYTDCPISAVLKSSNNIYEVETRVQTNYAAGSKPIKLNAAVLYDDSGKPEGGIISFTDISPLEIKDMNFKEETLFEGIIGHSRQMQELFNLIKDISYSDAPVFIHGESGTGKELIADAVQRLSARKNNAYIKINCSAFPTNLLSGELFGHVKGAFTDAKKDRTGRFELADKGTIFLDEIAEMPLRMQVQLLRVLQEGTFERLGESITRKVNVRVIAATNINIEEALVNGTFREDLYYRLNVIPIEVPPLRNRTADILPLIKHFLTKFSAYYKKEVNEIGNRALDLLLNYSWPGNIRELENVLEYAFIRTAQNTVLDYTKFPESLVNFSSPVRTESMLKLSKSTNSEKEFLLSALAKNKWSKTETAKELGIGRSTLWRKLKQYGIE